jgi:glycosyltransferase involved in cell wall biosynthesis
MIVKNEEHFLPDCLKSVQNLVNEMIIVDTGSSDRTISIAKSFGAKVYEMEWKDDFAAARNKALQYASNPWILQLDADEELPESSHAWFREAYPWPNTSGYIMDIQNLADLDTGDLQFSHGLIRFYKNAKRIRYENKIHEAIVLPPEQLHHSGATIIHKGYADRGHDDERSRQNEALLQQQLRDEPENPRIHGYLAQHYASSHQLKKADEYAKYALDHDVDIELVRFTCQRIRFTYALNHGKAELLEELYEKTSAEEYPTKYFFKGIKLFKAGPENYEHALSEFEQFLRLLQDHPHRGMIIQPFISIAYQSVGQIFMHRNEFDRAIPFLKKALQHSVSHYQPHALLGKCYINLQQPALAKEQFQELIKHLKHYQPSGYETLVQRYQNVIKSL